MATQHYSYAETNAAVNQVAHAAHAQGCAAATWWRCAWKTAPDSFLSGWAWPSWAPTVPSSIPMSGASAGACAAGHRRQPGGGRRGMPGPVCRAPKFRHRRAYWLWPDAERPADARATANAARWTWLRWRSQAHTPTRLRTGVPGWSAGKPAALYISPRAPPACPRPP